MQKLLEKKDLSAITVQFPHPPTNGVYIEIMQLLSSPTATELPSDKSLCRASFSTVRPSSSCSSFRKMHSKKCPGSTRAVENRHMIHSLPIGNLNRLIAHLHLASPISSSLCSLHSHLHPCQPQHLSQHFLGSLLLSLYSSHLGVQATLHIMSGEEKSD